jgi:ABC-type bacteriocin/lantibiotic exporter with double-glycine peptidase domain
MARLPGWLGVMTLLAGCYTGSARSVSPAEIVRDRGWLLVRDVPFFRQRSDRDCGAAALAMVLQYWGVAATRDQISAAQQARQGSAGSRAGDLRDFSRARGLEAFVVKGQLDDIVGELSRSRPVIVGLAKPYTGRLYAHYEVVVGLHRERRRILTLDPARGWRENSVEGFAAEWVPAQQLLLVVFRTAGG